MPTLKILVPGRDSPIQGYLNVWDFQVKSNPKLIECMLSHRNGNSTPINARNCSIVEISSIESAPFLNLYHLDKAANAKIHLGLFFQNELVGVLTAGKPRYARNFDLEILRVAFKSGYNVRGGTSKMFAYLEKGYPAGINLLSYSDNMIGSGKVYELCGFTNDGNTGASYFWYKNGIIVSRHQAQKSRIHKIVKNADVSLTEKVIMHNDGWIKVSDLGNTRWVKIGRGFDELTINYLYKITRHDGAYYYGVHSTNNINDGYLGSGIKLRASYNTYGVLAHTKEILSFYPSRQTLLEAEKQLVDINCLNDPLCLNISLGGGNVILPNGTTTGKQWMCHSDMVAIFADEKERDILKTHGWQMGRGNTFSAANNKWYHYNGTQHFNKVVPDNAKLGRLSKPTTGKTWVSRDGRRQLVDKVELDDIKEFVPAKTNKGLVAVVKNGVQKFIHPEQLDAHLKYGWVKPSGRTSGKIGMRDLKGVKHLLDTDVARYKALNEGWTLACKQLKSAPPQVLQLAIELGMSLPRKRNAK